MSRDVAQVHAEDDESAAPDMWLVVAGVGRKPHALSSTPTKPRPLLGSLHRLRGSRGTPSETIPVQLPEEKTREQTLNLHPFSSNDHTETPPRPAHPLPHCRSPSARFTPRTDPTILPARPERVWTTPLLGPRTTRHPPWFLPRPGAISRTNKLLPLQPDILPDTLRVHSTTGRRSREVAFDILRVSRQPRRQDCPRSFKSPP